MAPTTAPIATTFTIFCGCGCGETVEASSAGFAATTCEVAACTARREAGMVSFTVRKSAAFAAAVPTTTVAHRDGLVCFAG